MNDYDLKNSPLYKHCMHQLTGEYAMNEKMQASPYVVQYGLQVEIIRLLKQIINADSKVNNDPIKSKEISKTKTLPKSTGSPV